MAKALKASEVNFVVKNVIKKYALNFTDIANNNNKAYLLEVQEDVNGKYALFTSYGRVGGSFCNEMRMCSSASEAESEAEKIIKSKLKKGYVEVKLTAVAIGSDVAKSTVSADVISEDLAKKAGYKIQEENKSTLHPSIQSVLKTWFGSIEQFVINTLDTSKCALGQLSIDQINKGRDLLLEARKIVAAGGKDITELNNISSKYYSNIPMNFGYKRLDANVLRFDTNDKLDTAFELLDTLEGAKDVEKILTKKNAVDEQYKSLKTDMEYIDPSDPLFKWIDLMFHKTRAHNHGALGKMRITNLFRLSKHSEKEKFLNCAQDIAKKGQRRSDLPDIFKPIWNDRFKELPEYEKLMIDANILPLYHGSRTENFRKILSSSPQLLLPKPGFTVAGAMFSGGSGGLYFASNSSKSCQYSSASGSYWANGRDKKGYLFLADVALGKQQIATRAYPYTLDYIKPNMSVWARSGPGYSLINDEFIVYQEAQAWLKYVIEFETNI